MAACIRRKSLLFAVTLLTLAAFGQTKAASPKAASEIPFDSFRSFSAEMTGGLRNDQNRKIYRSGNLMRLDFDDHYRVVDLSGATTWGVEPKRCAFIAAPDAGSFPFSAPYQDFKVERSLTDAKETVDGHSCRIEEVTFTPPIGGPAAVKMKLWEAEDLEWFPVKIEVESNGKKLQVSYKNVSLKTPDAALFAHPAKCQEPAKDAVPVTPGPAKKAPPAGTAKPKP